MPETSGVNSSPAIVLGRRLLELSTTPLMPKLPRMPGLSSGRAVLMLMVAPMPPVGVLARLVLKTSMPAMASEARLPKSKARELEAPVSAMLDAGIWRPLSSTRLKSGPTPRTVTREPSPMERSIETPLMRCSDSARLVSGNLPMSSAEMPSTTPCPSRFMLSDDSRLERMPLTMTVCATSGAGGLAAGACCASAVPAPASATAQAAASSVTRKLGRRACGLRFG